MSYDMWGAAPRASRRSRGSAQAWVVAAFAVLALTFGTSAAALTQGTASPQPTAGDGSNDLAVWRPSDGVWYVRGMASVQWGAQGDKPVAGDYDGDHQTDYAVWRPSSGTWYVRGAATALATVQWGVQGDVPVPADYDGDGKTDFAVWRPSTGTWFVRSQSTTYAVIQWGKADDVPVPGDYNGDGKTDFAVWRPSSGMWHVRDVAGVIATFQWGADGDAPVAADYNGDGKTDFGVWRPVNRTWYVRDSAGPIATVQWGAEGDRPLTGDYDGDGNADFTVWRPNGGTWFVRSQTTPLATVQWGKNDDTPISADFTPLTDSTPPSAPSGLSTTGSTATSLTVTWTASSDNIGVVGYGRYRDGTLLSTAAGTTFTYTGLACGTSYTIAVDAADAAGNRSTATQITASTAACGDTSPPSVPSGLVVSAVSGSSVSVSWVGSSDNVGVVGYGRYLNGTMVSSGAGTSFTFSGLVCGSTYSFAVDAFDGAGNRSAWASVSGSTSACAPPAGGANVFVSTSGSDAASCSQAAPCLSFNRAYRIAAPGQVVEVAGGSYGAQTIGADASKTSGSDVVFRPAAGASVTVTSFDLHASHLELRDIRYTSSPFLRTWRDVDDVTFRNLTGPMFTVMGSSNVSFLGGSFGPVDNRYSSVQSEGANDAKVATNVLFDGVTIHDYRMTDGSSHVDCLHVFGANGLTVRNSRFQNCEAFAILFTKIPNSSVPTPTNVTLENNFFDCCRSGYFSVYLGDQHGELWSNFLVRNNSTDKPIGIGPQNTTGSGLRFFGNVGPSFQGCGRPGVSVDYNVWYSGSKCGGNDKVAAAGFVNQAAYDFHLVAGAAAINAGNPASYPSTDIDGQTRPAEGAPDAGADETSGSAPPPPPPPPPADTQAPTMPTGLTASAATQTSVNLSWNAASDNVAVTAYRVLRNGTLVGSGTQTSYTASGLACGTSYSFAVQASDAAGNLSPSASLSASSAACSTGGGGGGEVGSLSELQAAVSSAASGSTILVRAGSYGALSLNTRRSGLVTIKPSPGAQVSFADLDFGPNAAYIRLEGLTVNSQVGLTENGASFIEIARCTVRGISAKWGTHDLIFDHNLIQQAPNGIELVSTASNVPGSPNQSETNLPPVSRVRITGNKIVAPSTDAIFITNFREVLVEGNEITGLVERGQHADALQSVWGGAGLIFRRNYIHNNSGTQGFFLKDGRVNNVTVEDNLIVTTPAYNSYNGPPLSFYNVQPDSAQPYYTGYGIKIINNTIWDDGNATYIMGTENRQLYIHDNVLQDLQISEATKSQIQAGTIDQNNNIIAGGWNWGRIGSNDIAGPPQFRDKAGNDYRITDSQATSIGMRPGITWTPTAQQYGP